MTFAEFLRARWGSLSGVAAVTALNLYLVESGATDVRWVPVQVVATMVTGAVIVGEAKWR